jgi:hypothetical protein
MINEMLKNEKIIMTIFLLQQHNDALYNYIYIIYFPPSYDQFIIQFQFLILN